MRHPRLFLPLFLFFLFCAMPASAELDDPVGSSIEAFLASLNFQAGEIALEDDLVTLNLSDSFRYLSPDDTEKVLVDAWGNPPGNQTLGMIVPADTDILSDHGWAVIISYEEDGYVSDENAEEINYDDLLVQMKEESIENNKVRVEAGYEPMEFVGWAAPPLYDKESKKLYWAKELQFGDSEINTLNYNIRILGRKGVLVLNVVAGMPQFQEIDYEVPTLLAMTEFNPGSRYSDFNPDIDSVAAYGVGALIAGKVASKVGLLAKFGGVLLVLKKLWIAIALAIGAFAKKLFKKKDKEQVFTPEEAVRKDK